MRCNFCGAELAPNSISCKQCGEYVDVNRNGAPNYHEVYKNQYNKQKYEKDPYERLHYGNRGVGNYSNNYQPISPWGYIGYNMLFAIPIVGLVFLLIYACSSNGNVNVRNYAISYLIGYAFLFIVSLLCGLTILGIVNAVL